MSTMVRLNASIRDQTVAALLKKRFLKDDLELDKMREELEAKEKELHDMGYEACFTKKQLDLIRSIPNGWLPSALQGKVRIEDAKNPENYSDEWVHWGEERPLPHKNSHHGGGQFLAVLQDTHPYVVAMKAYKAMYRDWNLRDRDLKEKKYASRQKVQRIIESVTTVKRLTEIWPEVQEFLPEMVSGDNGGVPANIIADINKEFGL